jgi:hypothetical protein
VRKKPKEKPLRGRWKKSRLESLIARALVDADDEEEQQMAFFEALEEHLKLPFRTTLGKDLVTVRAIEVDDDDEILAICHHQDERFEIPLLDLVIPKPAPPGAEWIEALRLWVSE